MPNSSKKLSIVGVFIHRSIKTRIETIGWFILSTEWVRFLYIDPLKQGLKHLSSGLCSEALPHVFIHRSIKTRIETPEKYSYTSRNRVFIHRSIKTRIETIVPKLGRLIAKLVFIHRSIKTRIETIVPKLGRLIAKLVFIHRSIKTRIET